MNQRASVGEAGRRTPVEIDLLDDPRDWPSLKAARLRALEETPHAFVGTKDEEERRSSGEWMANIRWSTWVVARVGGEVVGIACLAAALAGAQERFIESVWVAPRHRLQGLVRRMLSRLETEACVNKVEHLKLWVLETNDAAYDVYLKLDFSPVPDALHDSEKPWGNGTFVKERLMVKQLF